MECQQGMLSLPDTWFRLFWGLAYVLIVETIFPKHATILNFFNPKYPSVLFFFLYNKYFTLKHLTEIVRNWNFVLNCQIKYTYFEFINEISILLMPCYVAVCNNYAICNKLQTALNCNAVCNTLQTAFRVLKNADKTHM